MTETSASDGLWQKTACILCSVNCGLEVQIEDGHFSKIRGNREHVSSEGYLCQKAARLDYYQNHADRLDRPLRRRADGTFEPVSWDTAISEIAAKLVQLRDQHGGHSIAYYGGGGQGNHLPGVFASSLKAALKTRYHYSALAQEKTGDFWVNGQLFGRQTCHATEDVEHADFVIFLGTNPWQAHGFPQARKVLQEISRDPKRTMVVIDPRRSETAELADIHLQLRPGTDAFLLTAILGLIAQNGLEDDEFLARRTRGFESLREILLKVPVEQYVEIAGVPFKDVERVARGLATAKAASVRADLGIQQSLHSTLNSYLEKMLYLITGNFGREGTNTFHTFFLPLIGHSDEPEPGARVTKTSVTGMREIGKLFPPNVLPAEIDTDHPQRVRGLIVDSANPLVTGADTHAYRKACEKLELMVVIDVALTETARLAHYVLPASTQFEKYEATFFCTGFPTNTFHLRRPLLPPKAGTLPEYEIYRRLLVAMGEIPNSFPLLKMVAKVDRRMPRLRLFPLAFKAAMAMRPRWQPYATAILVETLGTALPNGAKAAAPLWFAANMYAQRHGKAVRRAGIEDRGIGLGEALFSEILEGESGVKMSTHEYEDTWDFIRYPDGRIRLDVPLMLDALSALAREAETIPARNNDYPLVLIAGERRSYNANTIYRDPNWRKLDREGSLRIHPEDAARLGIADGDQVCCESRRGKVQATAEVSETVRTGMVTLPHGYGMRHPDAPANGNGDSRRQTGPLINELTAADHCDEITKTPFHKWVPVRVTPVAKTNAMLGESLAAADV